MIWWKVKVYNRVSGTTTTLSMYAEDEEHIRKQLSDDNY